MIDTFLAWLQRRAERRLVLLFLALFLLFNAVLIPIAGTYLEGYSGGVGPLDQQMGGFSAVEAGRRLAAYTLEGRLVYLLSEWTLGVAASLVTLAFFGLALSFVMQRAFPPEHILQRAPLAAVAAAASSWLEIAAISYLLLTFPGHLPALAAVAGAITVGKWITAFVCMALLLVGIAALALQRQHPVT